MYPDKEGETAPQRPRLSQHYSQRVLRPLESRVSQGSPVATQDPGSLSPRGLAAVSSG